MSYIKKIKNNLESREKTGPNAPFTCCQWAADEARAEACRRAGMEHRLDRGLNAPKSSLDEINAELAAAGVKLTIL